MSEERELRERARELMERLAREAESSGYHLNPDPEFTLELCMGLLTNLDRYGYPGCPCRLMDGDRFSDLDLICPCDYRDPDLGQYGSCYCTLYVSREILQGKKEAAPIPERRPAEDERKVLAKKRRTDPEAAGIKTWRCKVCGYLSAREKPPEQCPICFAERDRFETYPMAIKEKPT